MKKLIAAFLVVTLIFTGCSTIKEDQRETESREPLMQEISIEPEIIINPVLYFLNSSKTRLAAEAREISVPQGGIAEEYIVEEMLRGPSAQEGLEPISDRFEFDYVEVLPDVINLYLKTKPEQVGTYLSEQETMNTKLAFAATLSDYSGKKYVNVMIDESQHGFKGVPTGPLEKSTSNFSDTYTQIEQKATVAAPDMNVILYFLDTSESYILPEARKLVFSNTDVTDVTQNYESYAQTLVKELIKGPQNTYNLRTVIDSTIELEGAQIVDQADGTSILVLNFDKIPIVYTQQFMDAQNITLAALAYTLTGFIPGISGIQVQVRGVPIESGAIFTPEQYRDMVGSNITLYFPNSSYTMLYGAERIISQSLASQPEVLLTQLMEGPSSVDRSEVWPAMPAGLSMDDVNSVYTAGDMAVVDFASGVQDKLAAISEQDEFIMVYSIVNTLTTLEGVKRVQFLVDGQRVDSLGGGTLDVTDPMIKNPGIINLS